jgi:hypothetical protein
MEVLFSFVPLCFPSWFCGAAFCSFGKPPIPPDAPVTMMIFFMLNFLPGSNFEMQQNQDF